MGHALDRTAGRSLDRPFSSFDTMAVLADLKAEIAQAREGRSTTILHKEEGLQVALIAMRAGSRSPRAIGKLRAALFGKRAVPLRHIVAWLVPEKQVGISVSSD